jgi:non-ribosomal peptide synthetase component F
VMFQLFTPGGSNQGRGNSSGQIALNRGTAMFDIAFHLFEGTDEVHGQIEYSTDLFRPETIERMAGQFRVVLEAMVADSERRLGDLPLLCRTEREQILGERSISSSCSKDRWNALRRAKQSPIGTSDLHIAS